MKFYGLLIIIALIFAPYEIYNGKIEDENDRKIQQKIQEKYAPILINDNYLNTFLAEERKFYPDLPVVKVRQIE
ncbi:hypothetical protein DZB84_13700 [Bacillus sp. HNG]|uniref:hypothetical protein n=1 Tax=Bacillus sp. HNG TaxID=2293325 RepID=UPI000E2F67B8|nr:hypothetical protein [Bacillus sp. HNG]RFB14961.1 hypothetical protein DZB84_13700 [Bacillus sp. HNG]